MQEKLSVHGSWTSRWAFILAATGSAVGLGNIWKFPYITGENGGGAFVLVYLLCILLTGIPIMMAEIMLGRRGRQSPVNSMRSLAVQQGLTSRWAMLGWMGALAGFMVFSFYSVVAGWVLYYVTAMGSGAFIDIGGAQSEQIFTNLLNDPETMLIWHTAFVVMVMMVIAKGVSDGLERATKIMMPMLFVLLLLLFGYSMTTGHFLEGMNFMFSFDLEKLTWHSILAAMGHAFFTLSLGLGAIMAYGAYLPRNTEIGKTVLTIAGLDTLVALVAGMAIFPIVFANELDPTGGPGLMFLTLPVAFGNMAGGQIFGFLFFTLIAIAAWTSAISLMEPACAWLIERYKLKRGTASVILGVLVWMLGVASLLSFNAWSEVKLFNLSIFDFMDFMTANLMLPLGGLLIAVFAGWIFKREYSEYELTLSPVLYNLWLFAIRFIAPLAVATVFAFNLYSKIAG